MASRDDILTTAPTFCGLAERFTSPLHQVDPPHLYIPLTKHRFLKQLACNQNTMVKPIAVVSLPQAAYLWITSPNSNASLQSLTRADRSWLLCSVIYWWQVMVRLLYELPSAMSSRKIAILIRSFCGTSSEIDKLTAVVCRRQKLPHSYLELLFSLHIYAISSTN